MLSAGKPTVTALCHVVMLLVSSLISITCTSGLKAWASCQQAAPEVAVACRQKCCFELDSVHMLEVHSVVGRALYITTQTRHSCCALQVKLFTRKTVNDPTFRPKFRTKGFDHGSDTASILCMQDQFAGSLGLAVLAGSHNTNCSCASHLEADVVNALRSLR